jgi:hypothetical protein
MDLIRRGGNRAFQCGVMGSWSGSEIRKTSEVRKPSRTENNIRKGQSPRKPCGKEKCGGIGRENYVPKNKD